MWLGLIARFWKPALGILIGLWAVWYLHHRGYESGYAASEAHWQGRFAAAERERDAANARADQAEARSTALSQQFEVEHAKSLASLQSRAADAELHNRRLVRQLAARARCGAMPEAGGAAAVPDAATASSGVADRVAHDLTELARRCAADALTLSNLQRWVTEQRTIFSDSMPPAPNDR